MADINDNTINITISAPSADSNTISVVNPALKNNVVVNDARITPSERAKLASVEVSADATTATNVAAAGAVMITTDQSIEGTKTFNGPLVFNGGTNDAITVQNQTPVNFLNSTTTFGTGSTVIFNGTNPKFRTPTIDLDLDGAQTIKKHNSGNFTIQNRDLGNLSIRNDAVGGSINIESTDGDITINAGNSGANNNKLLFYARQGIEFNLSSGGGSISSPFKIVDNNPNAGSPSDIFTVDRNGDVTIKNANNNDVFRVVVDPVNAYDLDYIEIGGPNGYKFPKPEANMAGKTLVVSQDNSKMEFLEAVSTTIGGLGDVNISSVQPGQVLVWDGSDFLPGNAPILVANPAPATDNILVFGASGWAPQSPAVKMGVSNATLEADLDVSTHSIITTSGNQNITVTPHGTGSVSLGAFEFAVDQAVGAGTDNHVLSYDDSTGKIQLEQLALSDLSDVSAPSGFAEGDVIQANASGSFSAKSAFDALMSSAYLLADNLGAPLPTTGTIGDFNGDNTVSADDLILFLGMFGESSLFDGNTSIVFSDITPTVTLTGAQSFNINAGNYNTQSTTTNLNDFELATETEANSVANYEWYVDLTAATGSGSDTIRFDRSDNSAFPEWFNTAKFYFQDPSEIDFGVNGSTESFNYCLYASVTRQYSGQANVTDVYPIATYLGVPSEGVHNLNAGGQVSISDAFKKNTNQNMPYRVTLAFHICLDPSSFEGTITHKFVNLKLKIAA